MAPPALIAPSQQAVPLLGKPPNDDCNESSSSNNDKVSYNRLFKAITKRPKNKRRGPPSIAVKAVFDDPSANFEDRVNQCFDKVVTKNIWTGRSVQNLVCRICGKSINKLCNMKDHARRHL